MVRFLFVSFLIFLLESCSSEAALKEQFAQHEMALQEMIAADRAFSDSTEKNGMRKSFLEFAADESVLLRPGYLPIAEDGVIRYLSSQEDTSFTMSWEPVGADLAESNELGYIFGLYKVVTKDTILKGTYVSIWRKQTDGSWKFVLDSGNPGADSTLNNRL